MTKNEESNINTQKDDQINFRLMNIESKKDEKMNTQQSS